MKIIESIWFTEMGGSNTIGIALCKDETTGERKAYIGTGYGYDEAIDAERIMATGAKFHLPTALTLARFLGNQ